MEKSFWDSKWEAKQIGFHRDTHNPNLIRHWPAALKRWGGAEREATVGVPLCGKSKDLLWLKERSRQVTGVEFVRQAADEFFAEQDSQPEVKDAADLTSLSSPGMKFLVGDFFQLAPEIHGKVDLIYDRAALVAISPERREEYVAKLRDWLTPGGAALLISFEHDSGSGPPFSVPEVEALFAKDFEVEHLESHSLLEEEPRFKESCTFMNERNWLMKRRV